MKGSEESPTEALSVNLTASESAETRDKESSLNSKESALMPPRWLQVNGQKEYSRGFNVALMKRLEFKSEVIDIATNGYNPTVIQHEPSAERNNKSSLSHPKETELCLSDLLASRRVKKVEKGALWDINPLTMVIKPNKLRLCIDTARTVNKCIPSKKFRMRGLEHRLRYFRKGVWLGKIDLKNGYLHIPLHEEFKKFLGFEWKGSYYRYEWLPFGINDAPRIFQAFTNEVVKSLTKEGVHCEVYLDDFWIEGDSYEECQRAIWQTAQRLEDLGFTVNKKKSVLTPCQKIEYLGVIFNSRNGTIAQKPEKVAAIREKMGKCRRAGTARAIRRILGEVSHCAILDQRLKPFMMRLFRQVGSRARDEHVTTTDKAWEDLATAISYLDRAEFRVKESFDDVCIITSDASKHGFAFWDNQTDKTTAVEWNSKKHSTATELIAACRAIRARARPTMLNVLRTDNTTGRSILNQGSSKREHLNAMVKDLCEWAFKHNVHFTALYLEGSKNTRADLASRRAHGSPTKIETKTPPGDITYSAQAPIPSPTGGVVHATSPTHPIQVTVQPYTSGDTLSHRELTENSAKREGKLTEKPTNSTTNPRDVPKTRSEGRVWELQHEAIFGIGASEANYRTFQLEETRVENILRTIDSDVDISPRYFRERLSKEQLRDPKEVRATHKKIMAYQIPTYTDSKGVQQSCDFGSWTKNSKARDLTEALERTRNHVVPRYTTNDQELNRSIAWKKRIYIDLANKKVYFGHATEPPTVSIIETMEWDFSLQDLEGFLTNNKWQVNHQYQAQTDVNDTTFRAFLEAKSATI